jgi:hypothetical protein
MCLISTISLDESQGICNIIIEIKNLKNQKIFYNFILNNIFKKYCNVLFYAVR